jgi:hypothetical protein
MHRRCVSKYLVFLSLLVYAFLTVGSVSAHCHAFMDKAGYEHHCPGCHWTYFFADTVDHGLTVDVDLNIVDESLPAPLLYFPRTPDFVLHNRAPPVDLT